MMRYESGITGIDYPFFTTVDGSGRQSSGKVLLTTYGQTLFEQETAIFEAVHNIMIYLRTIEKEKCPFTDKRSAGIKVDLGKNRSLQYIKAGSQSFAFKLLWDRDKYVIKMRRGQGLSSKTPEPIVLSQSYITEMLQTESIATNFETALADMNLGLNQFVFSTDMVCCVKFADQVPYNVQKFRARVEEVTPRLGLLLYSYIRSEYLSGNILWENIDLDLYDYKKRAREDNFILEENNRLVWIDPFVKSPSRFKQFVTGITT